MSASANASFVENSAQAFAPARLPEARRRLGFYTAGIINWLWNPVVSFIAAGAVLFVQIPTESMLLGVWIFTVLSVLLPLMLFFGLILPFGYVHDVDVHRLDQRPRVYCILLLGAAATLGTLLMFQSWGISYLERILAVSAAMCAGLMLLLLQALWQLHKAPETNFHASFHCAAASFSAVLLFTADSSLTLVAICFACALPWARVRNKHHTKGETMVGSAIGALSGAAAIPFFF